MEQKLSKIDELKELVEYAKAAKLLKVKLDGVEFEMHPLALQSELNFDLPSRETLEEMEMRIKAEALREAEENLYFSANSGRVV